MKEKNLPRQLRNDIAFLVRVAIPAMEGDCSRTNRDWERIHRMCKIANLDMHGFPNESTQADEDETK